MRKAAYLAFVRRIIQREMEGAVLKKIKRSTTLPTVHAVHCVLPGSSVRFRSQAMQPQPRTARTEPSWCPKA